jgi:UDP-glucose 4-epimerase
MLLGEGSREIDTGVSRHVGIGEALEHVDRCVENGLVPFVGRFKADNYIWGVRDQGKLLTICFCCRCCCIIKNSVKYLPEASRDSLIKLKGLMLETDYASCKACCLCVDACFIGARSLKDGRISYNSDLCKGCGHCMTACQSNAIRADVSDLEEAVADVYDRIDRLIEYD